MPRIRYNKEHYTKQEMISKFQAAGLDLDESDIMAGILARCPFGLLDDIALTVEMISKGKKKIKG